MVGVGDERSGLDTFMGYNYTREPEKKVRVTCPYCGSTNTELFSLFGQQLLTVQYYCNACHTPFERVKDDDVLNDYAARKEGQP
jgi:DNA-directed RNA polymerase subunit RPC12/RpoP